MRTRKIDSFQGEHRFLSNFFPSVVVLEDLSFPTVENAFQAAKAVNKDDLVQFIPLSPGQAKRLGRKIQLRPDWNKVRVQVMEGLLRQKFRHAGLKNQLLATGDAELIEGNTWGDTFWGVCRGVGQNNLGKLLMKIRAEIAGEHSL